VAPWLYEARRRYGVCVRNFTATSNHIHLLVRDRGQGEIAASMQLLQGCTAQPFNRRRGRAGAFWADRYHATAVETGVHLARCLVYIDLNMIRAGVVSHPADWEIGGYHEIQCERARYRIVDRHALADSLEIALPRLADAHRDWVEAALRTSARQREPQWSESVAVGGRAFVERVQRELGGRGWFRQIEPIAGAYILRESPAAYRRTWGPQNGPISPDLPGRDSCLFHASLDLCRSDPKRLPQREICNVITKTSIWRRPDTTGLTHPQPVVTKITGNVGLIVRSGKPVDCIWTTTLGSSSRPREGKSTAVSTAESVDKATTVCPYYVHCVPALFRADSIVRTGRGSRERSPRCSVTCVTESAVP